jgi:hypothetical protein
MAYGDMGPKRISITQPISFDSRVIYTAVSTADGLLLSQRFPKPEPELQALPAPNTSCIFLGETQPNYGPHTTIPSFRTLNRLSHPYPLTHLAWVIPLQVKPFIKMGLSHQVIRVYTGDKGGIEHKIEFLSSPHLRASYAGGGSKAATPINKRRSGAGSVADGKHHPR